MSQQQWYSRLAIFLIPLIVLSFLLAFWLFPFFFRLPNSNGNDPYFPNPPNNECDTLTFNQTLAFYHLEQQVLIGPRPPGSVALEINRLYIVSVLLSYDYTILFDNFSYWGVGCSNIIARPSWQEENVSSVIAFSCHYDTRAVADEEDSNQQVLGANDGASGVAVLLELARVFKVRNITGVEFLFFDAEDQGNGGMTNWNWIQGSTHYANSISDEELEHYQGLINLDMIGDKDLKIYKEGYSDDNLTKLIWSAADRLGYIPSYFVNSIKYFMLDDHRPFINRGIPAVNIIDFDYPPWHTTYDDLEHVSSESLGIVGRTMVEFMLD